MDVDLRCNEINARWQQTRVSGYPLRFTATFENVRPMPPPFILVGLPVPILPPLVGRGD